MSARLRGRAETTADATDVRMRGRIYAIPFEDVWQTSLRLAGGKLRNWHVVSSNDHEGRIEATARRFTGAMYDVVIEITLDQDAQTRVDARAVARKPGTDFGTAARMVRRFLRALDHALARLPQRGFAAHS